MHGLARASGVRRTKKRRVAQSLRLDGKVPIDKQKHFAVGLAVAVLAYLSMNLLAATVAAVMVGVAKEIYDMRHRPEQTPEVWDAIATAAGAIPVAVFHWVGR